MDSKVAFDIDANGVVRNSFKRVCKVDSLHFNNFIKHQKDPFLYRENVLIRVMLTRTNRLDDGHHLTNHVSSVEQYEFRFIKLIVVYHQGSILLKIFQ